MKSNLGMDMSKTLTIRDNIKKSKIVTILSSLIGATLFFVAYIVTKNIWLLSVTILLVGASLAFYFVVDSIEKKYLKAIIEADKKEKKNDR